MNKPFRKRFDTARLSREEAARQGRAAKLAWEYMPGPGRAVAFLNAHDVALGGRPIDLARTDPSLAITAIDLTPAPPAYAPRHSAEPGPGAPPLVQGDPPEPTPRTDIRRG